MTATNDAGVETLAARVADSRQRILTQLRKVIVGQDAVVDEVLMALFCGGHCLITGVPGLAKTLLVKTLAQILDLRFKRIQFTPDLMPSDITGTEVIEENRSTGHGEFKFLEGPLFANVILADEIHCDFVTKGQKYTPFGGAERFVALALDALRKHLECLNPRTVDAQDAQALVLVRKWMGDTDWPGTSKEQADFCRQWHCSREGCAFFCGYCERGQHGSGNAV